MDYETVDRESYEELQFRVNELLRDLEDEITQRQSEADDYEDKIRELECDYEILKQDMIQFDLDSTNPMYIADNISFHNAHEFAYHLYNKSNEDAIALYSELKYWVSRHE